MTDGNALAAGQPAPPFTLPARSGAQVALSDFAGKNDVLVYFYPKDDTPGCTKEACSLRDHWGELQAAGVVVLGISRDGADSHNAFAAKFNLPFELLTDADHAVHEAYGAWGATMVGMGVLRRSLLVGKDGNVRHVFHKVDTANHAEQVLAVLNPPAEPAAAPEVAPQPAPAAAVPAKPKTPAAPKAPIRKAAARKAPAKAPKAPARPPKKAARKAAKPAKKAPARPAGKPKGKAAPKKAAPRKPAPKKTAPKKTSAKKPAAKKAAPRRPAPKKTSGKKPARKGGKKR